MLKFNKRQLRALSITLIFWVLMNWILWLITGNGPSIGDWVFLVFSETMLYIGGRSQ